LKDDSPSLSYYRARYYDPGRGRFIGEDPIGFPGGDVNLYAYVRNRPLTLTDPSGHFAIAVPLLLPAAEAALGATIGLPSGMMLAEAISSDQGWINNPEANADHDRYKNRCNQRPPNGLSDCDKLKWLLQRELDCIRGMQEWDAKWDKPGRHAVAIAQRTRAVEKLMRAIQQMCGGCP